MIIYNLVIDTNGNNIEDVLMVKLSSVNHNQIHNALLCLTEAQTKLVKLINKDLEKQKSK